MTVMMASSSSSSSLLTLLLLSSICLSKVSVSGHGTMIEPIPRQPESVYWYQVGCMIGCRCSGGGKEDYPTLESVNCTTPAEPSLTIDNHELLTFNTKNQSPRGKWNQYMPWRFPGSSKPIDSCGIASGFLPDATVQYPHKFATANINSMEMDILQGMKGTELPEGVITEWNAGSIVDVSFYLVVNHGGGYQYRVCPKNKKNNNNNDNNDNDEVISEACFEQHPLAFADNVHSVVVDGQTNNPIVIPATDVSSGVIPQNSVWRRIPLPACNCDSGGNCNSKQTQTNRDFQIPYNDNDNDNDNSDGDGDGDGDAYGTCSTGLQFVPPHIAEGLWPEGYGYYVSRLTTSTQDNDKFNKDYNDESNNKSSLSPCSGYTDATTCNEDAANNCMWYTEKNVCYETRGDDYVVATEGVMLSNAKTCSDHTDEASCLAGLEHGEPCLWYASPEKTVCYYSGTKSTNNNSKDNTSKTSSSSKGDGLWYISDKLYAPSEEGDYILQWRWDNEQTPQIWTTCADIRVVPEGQALKKPIVPVTGTGDDGESDNTSAANNPSRNSVWKWALVVAALGSWCNM